MNIDLLRGLSRRRTKKIVLLFSGGIDSLAVGLLLQKKGYKIHRIYYSNENGEIVNTTLNALLKQELHHSRGSKYIMQ